MMNKVRLAATLFTGVFFVAGARAEQSCQEYAAHITRDIHLGDAGSRIALLERRKRDCAGTGLYDLALASFLRQQGRLDDSDIAASAGMRAQDVVRPNLLQIIAANKLSRGDQQGAYAAAKKIVGEFPSYPGIYYLLSEIEYQRHDYHAASDWMQKVIRIHPDGLAYMTLATSLYQEKKYEETVGAVDSALRIEPERIGRDVGIVEAVYALILLGRRDEARNLLRRHIDANPAWQKSEALAHAFQELQRK